LVAAVIPIQTKKDEFFKVCPTSMHKANAMSEQSDTMINIQQKTGHDEE